MVKVYYNEEVTDNLGDKKIAIVGYGSQGHAHAQNFGTQVMKSLSAFVKENQRKPQETMDLRFSQ